MNYFAKKIMVILLCLCMIWAYVPPDIYDTQANAQKFVERIGETESGEGIDLVNNEQEKNEDLDETVDDETTEISEEIGNNEETESSEETVNNEESAETVDNEQVDILDEDSLVLPEDQDKVELSDIFRILSENEHYSDLLDEDKQSLFEYFQLSEQLMEEAELKGINLLNSVTAVSRSLQFQIDLAKMIDILSSGINVQQLDSKLSQYEAFINRYNVDHKLQEELLTLFLENFDSVYIESAYIISMATQIPLHKLLITHYEQPLLYIEELKDLSEEELSIVEYIAQQWHVNLQPLQDYLLETDLNWQQLLELVAAFMRQYEAKDIAQKQMQTLLSSNLPTEIDYNKYIQAPFSIEQNNNETVQGGSGYLSYSIANYTLPGRNGLDLVLGITYDLSDANLLEADFYSSSYTDYDYKVYYEAKAYWSNWIATERYPAADIALTVDGTYETIEQALAKELYWENKSYTKTNYWGDGTDLIVVYTAYIEEIYDSESSYSTQENRTFPDTYNELHHNVGSGWSFAFSSIETDRQGSRYLHTASGGRYRIKFTSTANDSNLEDYTLKNMRLEKDNGSYTNTQNQKSAYVLIYSNGFKEYFGSDGRLLAMRDRYGNTISFEHQMVKNHPVISKIIDTLGRITTFQYQTTSTGKTLTITLPDSNKVQYVSETVPTMSDEYVLTKIIDQAGRQTAFSYNVQGCKANFSFFNKNSRNKANYYACLTQIAHPTGATTKYTYESSVANLGSQGSMEYFRLKTREDVSDGISNNKLTYTYSNNYSGYPTHNDASNLPTNYQYSMTATQTNSVATTYTFNSKRLPLKTEYKTGSQMMKASNYQYNADKLPTSITTTNYNIGTTQNASSTESYTYDAWGNVLTYTDALNHTTTYTYDSTFHLLTSEAKNGQKIEWTIHPTTGNVMQMKQQHLVNGVDRSIITSYTYDNYGNVLSETTNKHDAGSVTVNYEYSSTYAQGYLTRAYQTVRQADNTTHTLQQKYNYNIKTGDITSYIDGESRTFQYQYDSLGRLTKVINPDQSTQLLSYDDVNNIVAVTNEMGYRTRQLYDRLGRLIKTQTYKNGAWLTQEENSYDQFSRVAWSKDVSGDKTTYTYDSLDRITRITNPDNTYKQVRYFDAWLDEGNTSRVETIDELGYKATAYYNKLGNKVTEQLVDKVRYEYDNFGNLVKATDANGKITTYTYDGLNRLIQVTNALNETTSYEYDNFGHVIKTIFPNGDSVQAIYDDAGRVSKKIDGIGFIEQFKYDRNHNVVSKTDADGQVFTYTYNTRNMLTKISAINSSGTYTQTFTYNLAGQRISAQTDGRTFQYAYHADDGSLSKVTYPDGKFVTLTAYETQSKVTMIEPFGQTLNYIYDNRNRLDYITLGSSSTRQVDYSYFANGRLATALYAGGMKQEYGYYANAANQLQTVKHTNTSGTVLNSYTYSYDKNFNINTITSSISGKPVKNSTFAYDALNRIRTSSDNNETYDYDLRGNRQALQSNNGVTYGYANYKYNIWGQLIEAASPSGTTTYNYDPDGLLYERIGANGEKNRYYYLNGQLIAEGTVAANGASSVKAKYVYGNGLAFQIDAAGNISYYYTNGHGDIVELRAANGQLLNQYTYDIWGKPLTTTEAKHNLFRYSGEYWDKDTGLQYLRARWYDPSTGRFISEDTYEGDISNPLTLNLYTYVHNNPLRYVDPSGNVAVDKEVFNVNWQINEQKIIWHDQDNIMKHVKVGTHAWIGALEKRTEAENKAKELRKQNAHLPGLLSKDAAVMSAYSYPVSHISGDMKILVDNNNTIYYANKPGLVYTEQIHTQSNVEYWHGKTAKEAIGNYPLPLAPVIKGTLEATVNNVDVPKIGETTTIIYTYNEKNNYRAIGIVVTNNGEITSWSGWSQYK